MMKRWLAVASMCWLAGTACGDDAPSSEPEVDAAVPDAAAPGLDAGLGDVPPDAAPPEPDAAPQEPDGGPTGPTIESVTTSDGFTEVRQGELVELVITGRQLDNVTSVRVGKLEAKGVLALGQVRAWLEVPHGVAPAAYDVTVSGSDGSATWIDAIELTPYVISASASPDGHGTFQSPMALCDDRVSESQAGDTILLLAGEHDCEGEVTLDGGQTVEGLGAAATIVRRESGFRGFVVRAFALRNTTTFRDLTIDSGDGAIGHRGGGTLIVDRVAMRQEGIRAECSVACPDRVTVRASTFVDAVTGIFAFGNGSTAIEVSDSSFATRLAGIRLLAGRLTVNRATFERSRIGVMLDPLEPTEVNAEIADSTFDDHVIGVDLRGGTIQIRDARIRGNDTTPPRISERGIHVTNGEMTATRVTISGYELSGVEAFIGASANTRGIVNLTDVLIEGGEYGVRVHGTPQGPQAASLFMRSTTVRDQTVAAVSSGCQGQSTNDLNGTNQLSVSSGVALEDARIDPPRESPIRAVGITLNGRRFSGTALGVAEVPPHYRIVDDSGAIQFEESVPN